MIHHRARDDDSVALLISAGMAIVAYSVLEIVLVCRGVLRLKLRVMAALEMLLADLVMMRMLINARIALMRREVGAALVLRMETEKLLLVFCCSNLAVAAVDEHRPSEVVLMLRTCGSWTLALMPVRP